MLFTVMIPCARVCIVHIPPGEDVHARAVSYTDPTRPGRDLQTVRIAEIRDTFAPTNATAGVYEGFLRLSEAPRFEELYAFRGENLIEKKV